MGVILIGNLDTILEMLAEDDIEEFDYSDIDLTQFYCIQIKPFCCNHCSTMICYCSCGPHAILIFPSKEDDNLNMMFRLLKDDDYDPHIIRYSELYGSCITWEDAEKNGWIGSNLH
jgi:hypothetical protein